MRTLTVIGCILIGLAVFAGADEAAILWAPHLQWLVLTIEAVITVVALGLGLPDVDASGRWWP